MSSAGERRPTTMPAELQAVVRLFMSVSLDGFVATADGDASPLYPDLAELRHREPLRGRVDSAGADRRIDLRHRVARERR